MRRAAIDVGSNSVLLTVAEFRDDTWIPILETTAVTALGEGVKATGVLSERGMKDTLEAIKKAFDEALAAGAERVDAAATMAARLAANREEFLERAREQGTPVRLLSGEDEASLGLQAVMEDQTFSDYPRISIIDVGGHSTEIVTMDRCSDTPGFRNSFPIGTLGLLSTSLQAERPSGPDLMRAATEIDDVFSLAYRPGEAGTVVALGATGTNLITIREAMTEWDPNLVHGTYLDYEEISRSVRWLSSMTVDERSLVTGMEPGRERTLHAGALILERALFALRSEGCFVSVRGWRHALISQE
ncbi:MAG TPA: hypothetical protein PKA27_08465 [Fimbriimonadaceae bacterium]|nr:hypothetical protein [Fimbriimonadaceae bacterium]